jgi:hypothetical protein
LTAITELEVGEALVSFLDEKGRPSVTERVYVLPPASKIGPITPEQRKALMADSIVAGAYEKTIDRESAHELIKGRVTTKLEEAAKTKADAKTDDGMMGGLKDILFGKTGPRGGQHDGVAQIVVKSAVRTIGSSVGREIIRGVLGGIFGGRR